MSSCNTCNRIQHVSVSDSIPTSNLATATPVSVVTSTPVVMNSTIPSHSITSLEQVVIPPSESPTVAVIRSQDFTDTLVSIPDANVVKNICSPVEELPEDCPDCDNSEVKPTCENPKASTSTDTNGHELSHCWLDATPVTKMTLLGRVGRFLAKLTGEGVLWLDKNGEVSIKKFLPFRTSHLWHKWYKPTANSAPIIGNPMNYPYKVITDLDGNPFTIMGLPNEDSIEVYNHETQEYEQRPITDFPVCVSEKLTPSNTNFELVGFEALSESDSTDLRRCLKRISGEGMICLKRVPTAPTQICDCDSCEATGEESSETTVVEFIPYPTTDCADDSPFILTYTPGSCPSWQQATQIDSLKGDTGDAGADGQDGAAGADATVTSYNSCD